ATVSRMETCVACGAEKSIHHADAPLCSRCGDMHGPRVLGYWAALTALDRLHARGVDADPTERCAAVDRAAQLTDVLGAELALRVRERWSRTTGRCPLCGGAAH